MSFEAGSSFDRYRLESLIGQGGMGRVFRARDTRLGRAVALKILSPPESSRAPDTAAAAAARMLREARAAAAFNHPNVVAIYDVGEAEGTPYIAMELVEGAALRSFVRDDGVPVAQKTAWLLDVARALGAAHRAGLVHRDIKPENVVVTPEGVAKVLDFGIARRVEAGATAEAVTEAQSITAEGVVVGTPRYMAPEQLRGEPLDGRSDQFSWGVMAFELLSGRFPWNATDGVQLVAAILDPHPPRLDDVKPGLDPRLCAAVDKALRRTREERFATMEDLVASVVGAPVVVHSSGAQPAAQDPLARTELAAVAERSPPRRPRRFVVPGAVAAGLAAIVALAAFEHFHRGPSPAASSVEPAPPPPSAEARLPTGAAARASYQAAQQAFRDGQSMAWRHNLEELLQADPGFGPAYFWLAHIYLGDDDRLARTYYAKAVQLRSTFGEVDAALLEAEEPRLRDPPNRAERLVRMERLGARYPRELAVQYMLGLAYLALYRYDDATAAFDRALAVDPAFALSYENEAIMAGDRDDLEGASRLVARCLTASPASTDCRSLAVDLDSVRGDCAAAIADARTAVTADPRSALYLQMASAMARTGVPREGVAEMIQRSVDAETKRRDYFAHGRATAVATLYGDFETALKENLALEATTAGHVDEDPVGAELDRLDLLAEMSEAAALRKLATSLRARIGAWEHAADAPAQIALSRHELRAGLITREEMRRRRDDWMHARLATREQQGSQRPTFWDWELAFARTTDDKDDAREALEALDVYGPVPPGARKTALTAAALGRVYVLGGRFADAIPLLQVASRACDVLTWTLTYVRSLLDLGVALEHTGDTNGARTAYGSVLDWWGRARPRSITADAARTRLAALPHE